MGIEYSTKKYKVIANVIDIQPLYICSIDINNYITTEEANRYIVYSKKNEKEWLLYYGKIENISNYITIIEDLLYEKSKKFNSIEDLINYVKTDIKHPKLIGLLEKYNKIEIKPDLDYLNRLV